MDWIFEKDNYLCNLRCAGVIIENNKILLQREKNGCEYALPGGHVKAGESTDIALARELREEIGAEIICEKLIWSEECFWDWNSRKAHTIAFYYLIKLSKNSLLPDSAFCQKENPNIILEWIPLENLAKIKVYPEFLKSQLEKSEMHPKHFITREG